MSDPVDAKNNTLSKSTLSALLDTLMKQRNVGYRYRQIRDSAGMKLGLLPTSVVAPFMMQSFLGIFILAQ